MNFYFNSNVTYIPFSIKFIYMQSRLFIQILIRNRKYEEKTFEYEHDILINDDLIL